jgi:hypothetical protein
MNRFVSVRWFAILTVCSAFAAAPVQAQVVPHKERTAGTVDVSEMESTTTAVQAWTAKGNATHMGKYSQVGSHKVNLSTGEILDGVFTSTAADGSTVSGIFYGTFALNGDGSADYSVTAIWLSGTGRFEGLTGIADVAAHATGVTAGSTFRFVTDGVWNLP